MSTELPEKILQYISENGKASSLDLAHYFEVDHQKVIGAIKSLESVEELVKVEYKSQKEWVLTEEGEHVLQYGSHEAAVFNAIPSDTNEVKQSYIFEKVPHAKVGLSKALAASWVELIKTENQVMIKRKVPTITDDVQEHLKDLQSLSDDSKKEYKRRKLIKENIIKVCTVTKDLQFSTTIEKGEADLTDELLLNNSWETKKFKSLNWNAMGAPLAVGHFHPLLKVRSEFRKIFIEMGFEEMPSNKYVESSFWNFDALFQPQQHPARDAHDTFFLSKPEKSTNFPLEYLEKVRQIHSKGGYGSQGYRYTWKIEEAQKNVLRTHTTAVSARMLYNLMQDGKFKPVKYFSIDRVYRNETLDATHLAEFHQVEGVVADYNLTLGDLIGTLYGFFSKLGITQLEFKPAYNPYTEPSMEIFCYHEGLKKWIEIGNSGVFRPEMLLPMGLPENVNVIAWGLSLERPTMIKYGLDNIRDLVGPKVDLQMVQENPLCRLDKCATKVPEISNLPNTRERNTRALKLHSTEDIVIFCDPIHLPNYLEPLLILLRKIYLVKISVHFHSSVIAFSNSEKHRKFSELLNKLSGSINNVNNQKLSLVFIWRKPEIYRKPISMNVSNYHDITGVVNVARYFNRIIELHSSCLLKYESSSLDLTCKVDEFLEKIETLKEFNSDAITKFLQKECIQKINPHYLGNDITLIDVFLDPMAITSRQKTEVESI